MSGASLSVFSTGLSSIWIASFADLANVPTEFVTIASGGRQHGGACGHEGARCKGLRAACWAARCQARAAAWPAASALPALPFCCHRTAVSAVNGSTTPPAARRRLQSASDVLDVSTRIASSSPNATAAALTAAQASGELAATLATMNLTLVSVTSVAAPPASPSPAPATTAADGAAPAAAGADASGGSKTGAIVGGVVGGVAGCALLAAAVLVVLRRRREAAVQRGSAGGVTATVSRATRGAKPKPDLAEGHSSSPRSLTPRRAGNNLA